MPRLLFLLLITYLMAHVMSVQSRFKSRLSAQQEAEFQHYLGMLSNDEAFTDEDAQLDEHAMNEAYNQLYDDSEMDTDTDTDTDIDHDQIQRTTSFLESMSTTSTSTSAGVSYIAFGDNALQGGNTEYGVVLNGKPCGVAVGVTGGLSYFDIVEETNLETGIQIKKFGKHNVATINVAFDRPNPVLTKWIQETLNGKYALRSGSIQADDGAGKLKASLLFTDAYMSEVTFPRFSLDDASPAIWKMKISPHSTQLQQAAEGKLSGFRDKDKKFKPFANNFRFSITHVDPPIPPSKKPTIRIEELQGVRLIESFVVKTRRADTKQNITPLYSVGNLVFEVSQDKAGDLFQWMEKQHTTKKNGAISVYTPSGTLFYTIALKGMGIYKVHPMRAKPKQTRWLRVEIFVEQVKFAFNPQKTDDADAEAEAPAQQEGDDTSAVDGDDAKTDVE